MTISRKDWTLLALAAAEGRSLSPVQLQKSLFVLSKQMPEAAGAAFDFKPYNYGPFDAAIYRDAEELEREGLAHIGRSGRWSEYFATPDGMRRASGLAGEVDAQAMAYLKKVVAWARSLTFNDLVRAIYTRYPDMRARSIFDFDANRS